MWSMSQNKPAVRFSLLKDLVLLLCLFAPSAWMIVNVPPLWRDVDGYNQMTQPPLVATYWGHAPAYCYLAKVPLYFGEQVERRSMGTASSNDEPNDSRTTLTDAGIWMLIVAQHLALCAAAFSFIVAVTKTFWVRLTLALIWASNALFYTFAHCVGSETLSMVFVIIIVTQALRLIRSAGEPRWGDWYFFAVTLLLCLLSRHINLWLSALLPGALFASALLNANDRSKRLRFALVALIIGLVAITTANLLTHNLARKTRFRPHSRMGFTFLWRLRFLKDLSPESRAALLNKAATRTDSDDVRKLIALLGQMYQENAVVDAGPFMRRAIPIFFPLESGIQWRKLDGLLNQMAWAFLIPPGPDLIHAVKADLSNALAPPVTAVSNHLFASTAYYFDHKNEMPGCADLLTFRNSNAEEILQLPTRYSYFRLWHGPNYWNALVVWLVSLVVLTWIASRKRTSVGPLIAFTIALVATGLFMTISTCFLVEYVPRYGMPMWQLLLLSIWILVGTAADLVLSPSSAT
jgi:hypothetical protein